MPEMNIEAAMQGETAAREGRAQKQFDAFLQVADDIDQHATPVSSLDLTDPTLLCAVAAALVVLALASPEFRTCVRPLLQRLRTNAGWVAIIGSTLAYLCIRNFAPLLEEAAFAEPSVFTVNFGAFADDYEKAMANASKLSSYVTLMYWDSLFAVSKGIAAYALLHLLTEKDTVWPTYTVPIHVAIDLLENFLTFSVLTAYGRDKTVPFLVCCMPLVSSIKWSLAGLNTGSIPVLALYRAGGWALSKSKPD